MTLPLNNNLFKPYFEAVDWLLTNPNTSESCKVFYQSTKDVCPNCIYSEYGPSNTYNGTGPYPFSFGLCPECNGVGYKDVETTESFRMRVYWQPKDWRKIVNKIEYPDCKCMVLGAVVNLPKISRASKIQIFTEAADYNTWMFKLMGEPFLHGFNSRYFGAYLDRL